MMIGYILLLILSAGLSLALTPLVCRFAFSIGAVDRPGKRKIHEFPTPRLGGVSVVLSGILTIVLAFWLNRVTGWFGDLDLIPWTPILVGGAIIFLVGVWDDVRHVPVGGKFLFQSVAACVPIWFDIRINHASIFGSGFLDLGMLALPLTFLWIVGLTNAFNLIDGLDGLAAGLAGIAAGTCAVIFIIRGNPQDALLLVILVGALGGFLWYNFNPARIFLGDSGSLFIGYLLAVTSVTGSQKRATVLAVVIPLLVFGLPILDTFLSMLRRLVAGLRIVRPSKTPVKGRIQAAGMMFEADQSHIHHRLLALGFSHRHAVLAMYAIAMGLSLMALISVLAQFRNAGIILITVGLATYIGVRKLGYEEVAFLRTGTLLRWYEQIPFNRLFFWGFVDLILIAAAYWMSFVIKYEFTFSIEVMTWYLGAFPLVLLIQLGVFSVFGLYRGIWRTTDVGDLLQILFAVSTSVAVSYTVVLLSIPPNGVLPFFCIDLLVLAALAGGSRCAYRILDYSNQRDNAVGGGVIIYGAGRGGQLLLRELIQNAEHGLRPIGFIDDNPRLKHLLINRVPVLGSNSDLASILEIHPVTSVVISSNKIQGDRLQRVMNLCEGREISVLGAHMKLEPLTARTPELLPELTLAAEAIAHARQASSEEVIR